jgi:hypothetical protein
MQTFGGMGHAFGLKIEKYHIHPFWGWNIRIWPRAF